MDPMLLAMISSIGLQFFTNSKNNAKVREIQESQKEYQKAALEQIELESKRDKLESLFWAIRSKDQKLNNLLPKVVPKEFFQELVEGKVNSFLIHKPKQP